VEKTDAEKIITAIKAGSLFSKEVWDDSIIYRCSYDPGSKYFILIRMDTIAGYLFPELQLKEERILEILQADFDIDGLSDSRVEFC